METEIRINEVCGYIRKHVKRPQELPQATHWQLRELRWPKDLCPMGMLPGTDAPAPGSKADFWDENVPLTEEEIVAFATDWDSKTDAQAAVDRVWGKESRSDEMTEQIPIGDQIKEARLALRLNQTEAARLCNVGQTRISALESGKHRITEAILKKLEDGLGVKLNPAEHDITIGRQKLTFTDLEYGLLRNKIENLKLNEAINLPGTEYLAQLIRMSLRRDRPLNAELPIVSVVHSKENGKITIYHRREILRGADMKISKIDQQELPAFQGVKYEEMLNAAKEISDGKAMKIEFDNELEAAKAATAFSGYKTRGKIPKNLQHGRRGNTLYIYK